MKNMIKQDKINASSSHSWPKWLAIAYLLAVLLAIVLKYLPGGISNGSTAVILTLPWSVLGLYLIDAVSGSLAAHSGLFLTVVGGLVNAVLIYNVLTFALKSIKIEDTVARKVFKVFSGVSVIFLIIVSVTGIM